MSECRMPRPGRSWLDYAAEINAELETTLAANTKLSADFDEARDWLRLLIKKDPKARDRLAAAVDKPAECTHEEDGETMIADCYYGSGGTYCRGCLESWGAVEDGT